MQTGIGGYSKRCGSPVRLLAPVWVHHVLYSYDTVVVDRRENKDCDTGQFELAYKQVCECSDSYCQWYVYDYCIII